MKSSILKMLKAQENLLILAIEWQRKGMKRQRLCGKYCKGAKIRGRKWLTKLKAHFAHSKNVNNWI